MNHLDAAVIIDLLEQRLSAEHTAACRAHLEACSVCAESYHVWWHFISTIGSVRLANAPEKLTERCISFFPGAPPEAGFRQLIGQVLLDTLLQPTPALAIRGESAARQLIFSIEDVDIHIRIAAKGSKQTIQGHIVPHGDEPAISSAHVVLLALGRATLATTSDPFGVFDFRDVPKVPLLISIKFEASRLMGLLSISEERQEDR